MRHVYSPSIDLTRAIARSRKEAQLARERLTSDTRTFVSIGRLRDNVDLRTTTNRADFESNALPTLPSVRAPDKVARSKACLFSTDLHAVVQFGGESRKPRIQEELCHALDISSLNKSVNTGETVVIGSVSSQPL